MIAPEHTPLSCIEKTVYKKQRSEYIEIFDLTTIEKLLLFISGMNEHLILKGSNNKVEKEGGLSVV